MELKLWITIKNFKNMIRRLTIFDERSDTVRIIAAINIIFFVVISERRNKDSDKDSVVTY